MSNVQNVEETTLARSPDRLYEYALAAVHLYGAIRLEDFLAILNSQYMEKTTKEDILPLLLQHTENGYHIWEDCLIDESFEESEREEAVKLLQLTEGKPRYIPPQEKFLRYADRGYYESFPCMKDLKQFFARNGGLDRGAAEEAMTELYGLMKMEVGLDTILKQMEKRGIKLDTQGPIFVFAGLAMEVLKDTRLWSQNGHTPNETQAMGQKKAAIRKKKIGRNEPCPCGSGKKYKHCCGK